MSRLPIRVVKVGGSLFERPSLAAELKGWLLEQPPAFHILIAGGGELAESIRTWDARFQLGEVTSHWLCIEALSISAKVLHQLLGDISLLIQWADLLALIQAPDIHGSSGTVIFDVQQFLREVESTADATPLPHHWSVTTDSLAARVAELIAAKELVLLKSTRPPVQEDDFAALAAAGYVDQYFPQIAPRLRCVTFRDLEVRPPRQPGSPAS